jgi:hypothetical protein
MFDFVINRVNTDFSVPPETPDIPHRLTRPTLILCEEKHILLHSRILYQSQRGNLS